MRKNEIRSVRVSAAHGPENMPITRIAVSYAGAESHACFCAHRSRLMRPPSLGAEARGICATANLQSVKCHVVECAKTVRRGTAPQPVFASYKLRAIERASQTAEYMALFRAIESARPPAR